jgi:hypothetical protein
MRNPHPHWSGIARARFFFAQVINRSADANCDLGAFIVAVI